eukprot:g2865.t1
MRLQLLKRCFSASSRTYPTQPLIGVSVVILKEPDYKSVVLIERGQPPKMGEWSFPGGLLNVGESIEEAARREVYEEIGLTDINIINPHGGNSYGEFLSHTFTTTEHIYFDDKNKCQYHYFLGQILATTNASADMLKAQDDINNSSFFNCSKVINRDIGNDKILVERIPYVLSKALNEIYQIKCDVEK